MRAGARDLAQRVRPHVRVRRRVLWLPRTMLHRFPALPWRFPRVLQRFPRVLQALRIVRRCLTGMLWHFSGILRHIRFVLWRLPDLPRPRPA